MKSRHILVSVAAAAALIAGFTFYGVRVEATMEVSGNRCPSDQPIMVTFHNYTFRTVDGGYLILEALKDDSGPNLFAEPEKSFFSHMGPLESDVTCLGDSNFNFYLEDGETDNYRFNVSDATREILAWQSKTKGVGIRVQYLKVDH